MAVLADLIAVFAQQQASMSASAKGFEQGFERVASGPS